MKVVEEDQARIEKWDKKLDALKARRATSRHGLEELVSLYSPTSTFLGLTNPIIKCWPPK